MKASHMGLGQHESDQINFSFKGSLKSPVHVDNHRPDSLINRIRLSLNKNLKGTSTACQTQALCNPVYPTAGQKYGSR